jgi:hypothetical protein
MRALEALSFSRGECHNEFVPIERERNGQGSVSGNRLSWVGVNED